MTLQRWRMPGYSRSTQLVHFALLFIHVVHGLPLGLFPSSLPSKRWLKICYVFWYTHNISSVSVCQISADFVLYLYYVVVHCLLLYLSRLFCQFCGNTTFQRHLQWKPVKFTPLKVNNRLTSIAYVGPVFSALYFINLNPDNVNHLRP